MEQEQAIVQRTMVILRHAVGPEGGVASFVALFSKDPLGLPGDRAGSSLSCQSGGTPRWAT